MTFPTPWPSYTPCSAIEHIPRLAYAPDETGADVDWDLLAESWLSTTEKAFVLIAHGCAILERHEGGLPVELRWQVRAAVASSTE